MERYIDLLIAIKNGYLNFKKVFTLDHKGKYYANLCNLLKKYLIIKDFNIKQEKDFKKIEIVLYYNENNISFVNNIEIISRPTLPCYADKKKLVRYIKEDDKSLFFISTSLGTIDIARNCIKKNIGGKVLFKIW